MHVVPTGPNGWQWNGSFEQPTLQPSLSIRSGHYASAWKEGDPCWCGTQYEYTCYICHSIVTAGRIQFCPDSTHALSGQTVDLPEVAP